jgi:hypothetical protein
MNVPETIRGYKLRSAPEAQTGNSSSMNYPQAYTTRPKSIRFHIEVATVQPTGNLIVRC